jgi:hypothetical protein
MSMSEEDLAKHRALLALEASSKRDERTWVPIREIETIFRPSFTTRDGQEYRATDYGHSAFMMEVKGKHRKEKGRPIPEHLDQFPFEPIRSERRLKSGCVAGDRINHSVFGPGVILSISTAETILNFDKTGLKSIPTANAHECLRKEAPTTTETTPERARRARAQSE